VRTIKYLQMFASCFVFAAVVGLSIWMCGSVEIVERPGLVFFGVDVKGYTVDITPLKGILTSNWYAPSYAWRQFKTGLQRSISTTDAAIWRTYQRNLAKAVSSDAKAFLAAVNASRKKYAAGTKTVYEPMRWSPNLAEGARNYANCCPRAHSMPMYNQPFAEGLFGGSLSTAVQGMVREIESPSCTANYTRTITASSNCGHGGILLLAATVGCGVKKTCSAGSGVVCRYGTDYGLPSGTMYVYDNNCCNLHPQWYKTWLTYNPAGAQYSTKHAVQQPQTCVNNGADPNQYANAPYPNAQSDTSKITANWPPVPPRPSPTRAPV
jgi:hypothetical protein